MAWGRKGWEMNVLMVFLSCVQSGVWPTIFVPFAMGQALCWVFPYFISLVVLLLPTEF